MSSNLIWQSFSDQLNFPVTRAFNISHIHFQSDLSVIQSIIWSPLTHSLTHSLTHPLTNSLTQSLNSSFNHSFILYINLLSISKSFFGFIILNLKESYQYFSNKIVIVQHCTSEETVLRTQQYFNQHSHKAQCVRFTVPIRTAAATVYPDSF
jgi:hypothetical protein